MNYQKVGIAVLAVYLLTGFGSQVQAKTKSIGQIMRDAGFKHKNASWTAVSTHKDEKGKTDTTLSKIWFSGDKYRLEAVNAQDGKDVIFIDDGKMKYIYMPDEKKAIKITPDMESSYGQMMSADIIAESARQRKKAKKTGTGKVDGKKCTIYEYKTSLTVMNSTIKGDVKEWVWKKENFPLKSIMKTPRQKMDMGFMTTEMPAAETTTIIKDLKFGKKIKASMFVLPKGTKVETMKAPPAGGSKTKRPPVTKQKSTKQKQEEIPEEIPAVVKDLMKNFF
ncbi:hypothetical protein K8S19_08445 [bacterium]|nr:hypothetical protein [bacterium]